MGGLFSGYCSEARNAYVANRNQDAALLYGRAKEAARQLGDRAHAFEAGFWEAEAWARAGNNRRSFALLFALLDDAPQDAPVYERWCAETLLYELWLALGRRSRIECRARLERLADFAAGHPSVPAADLPRFRGNLAKACGDWAEAARWYEEGWAVHDGTGHYKSELVYGACAVSLHLAREQDAARWVDLLGIIEEQRNDNVAIRLQFHAGQGLLALFRGDRAAMDAARRTMENELASQSEDNDMFRYLLARLSLLLRPDDDPEDRFHPTLAILRQRLVSKHDCTRKFDRLMVLADFRLAALRYAVGMPACDDLYYRQPQKVPTAIVSRDLSDLARRLHHARAPASQ